MKRTWLATPLVLLVLAAGSYGLYVYLTPPPLPDGLLYGNGHIEGTEVRVSSEITGRVIEVASLKASLWPLATCLCASTIPMLASS